MFNPGLRRNASAWSLSDCILFTLEIKDFEAVIARFDKDHKLYNEMKEISTNQACRQKANNASQVRRQSFEDRSPAAPANAGSNAQGVVGGVTSGIAAAHRRASRAGIGVGSSTSSDIARSSLRSSIASGGEGGPSSTQMSAIDIAAAEYRSAPRTSHHSHRPPSLLLWHPMPRVPRRQSSTPTDPTLSAQAYLLTIPRNSRLNLHAPPMPQAKAEFAIRASSESCCAWGRAH